TGASGIQLKGLIRNDTSLFFAEHEQRVMTHDWLAKKQRLAIEWLEQFHQNNPSVIGAPLQALRQAVYPGIEGSLTDSLLRTAPGVNVQADAVALATHCASFDAREMEAIEGIVAA